MHLIYIQTILKVKKYPGLILILALWISIRANAQNLSQTYVTLKTKNAHISEMFDVIEQQTHFRFGYGDNLMQSDNRFSLNYDKISILSVLEILSKEANLSFRRIGDNISVSISNDSNSVGSIHGVVSDDRRISGTIKDPEGNTLPGVTIIVKGTTVGTISDNLGKFTIDVPDNSNILLFSHVGFITQEIDISNTTNIDLVMKADLTTLDKIVVTGYQEIPIEETTGSFETVSKQLDIKINQNILSKLEGEAPGVLFDAQDGLTIRGISTINANNAPLIVVDGFPLTQNISTINPNTIESITVLKDAAAASIWGIRAANGVVVIVTKKGGQGKGNKPSIEFSVNHAITPKLQLSNLNYASSRSFLDFERHQVDSEWLDFPSGTNQRALTQGQETFFLLNQGLISQSEADAITNNLSSIDSRDEFDDLFLQNDTWTQYSLAVGKSNAHNQYRLTLSYNQNRGTFIRNNRDNLQANLLQAIDISPKLAFTGNFNYAYTSNKPNGLNLSDLDTQSGLGGLDQYQRILDDQGNFIPQPRTFYQPFKESLVAQGYPYNWDYNAKQEFDNKDNSNKTSELRLQTSLKYKVFDFLSIEGRYQFEWGQSNTENLFNENTYRVRDFVNRFTVINDDNEIESALPVGSHFQTSTRRSETHSGRIQINFNKSFLNNDHNISAIAGYEVRQEFNKGFGTTRYGFDPQSLSFARVDYTTRHPITPARTRSIADPTFFNELENRFLSYYGNLAYTYKGKYTLSGSTRLDDANLFGADDEYRNIPLYSIGARWEIYKENFLSNSDFINQLTLRLTHGSNGNVHTGTSPFLQARISRNPFNDIPFAFVSNVKNPSLRLEKVFVTNIGVDFALFNSKLSGSIEYYKKKSRDLLSVISIPSVLGFSSALVNAGKMENTGVDISLNYLVVQNDNFSFNTSLNFSYNKNEVTEVDVAEETINTYLNGEPLRGNPLRYMYSYNYAGLDENGDPQALNENGQFVNVEGQIRNGDGDLEDGTITNPDALVYEGTTTPKYYGAWINYVTYKGFYLRTLFTFKFGHVFRNTDILDYRDIGFNVNNSHIHKDFESRWMNPGDENTTDIPRIPTARNDASNPGYTYYNRGNHLVDNASHIRFKEIVLGYTFTQGFLKTIGVSTLNLSLQARNLGVLSFNKWDIDPENIRLHLLPTYTLNLTANF